MRITYLLSSRNFRKIDEYWCNFTILYTFFTITKYHTALSLFVSRHSRSTNRVFCQGGGQRAGCTTPLLRSSTCSVNNSAKKKTSTSAILSLTGLTGFWVFQFNEWTSRKMEKFKISNHNSVKVQVFTFLHHHSWILRCWINDFWMFDK